MKPFSAQVLLKKAAHHRELAARLEALAAKQLEIEKEAQSLGLFAEDEDSVSLPAPVPVFAPRQPGIGKARKAAILKMLGGGITLKRSEIFSKLEEQGIATANADHLSPLLSIMKNEKDIDQDEHGSWKLRETIFDF